MDHSTIHDGGAGISSTVVILSWTYAQSKSVFYRRTSWWMHQSQLLSIPDGPRGFPIVGSFPFLTRFPELSLDRWARKYGPLYSINLGDQLFVIISDPGIAKDLMVSHGGVFSDRKELFMKSHTIFKGRGITPTPYNDLWKKHRRIANMWLSHEAVDSYTSILDYEATDMIRALYKDCDNGRAHINPQTYAGRCSLNNMLTITFGFRANSIRDPIVKRSLRLSREFMNLTGPVSNLVDFVPILQKIPTWTRTRGRKLHDDLVETYGGFIKEIDGRLQRGEEVDDCLAKTMLKLRDKENLDHLDMAMLASAFMIGGVETTASLMQWFSALIPAYPEIQKRAQEELDRVVGRDRLPTLEDEVNLPYCHAITKEIARCHNPFWLGTPHVASEDFVYGNKLIPKGTVIALNTWTMHHNPDRYPRPMEFDPSHYLTTPPISSSTSSRLSDPFARDHWMFGAGRRICPAILVAEREIWLAVSRMLWAFEMVQISGKPIDLSEYDGLSGRSPVPFEILLSPRFEGVGAVLGSA
ncbi:cytochrome P450 [Clohesyomyces aquaticus]|uniref:Cytochrome P450 n=1 Tax=Clohesyomyces aquaticus TaxID=1231657 RepID=A0A1Y1Y6Z6_9PLEO|nr:cytochrome P450 [Clohesyomyces aquaticus]